MIRIAAGIDRKQHLPTRSGWCRDIISAFEEQDIGWANWDYKGQFGIVTSEGLCTGIAEVMLAGSGAAGS